MRNSLNSLIYLKMKIKIQMKRLWWNNTKKNGISSKEVNKILKKMSRRKRT